MQQLIKNKLATFPDNPGVYLMKDTAGEILYVGKAVSLRNRIRSYFQDSSKPHALTIGALRHVYDIDYIVTDNEVEALILENNLIKQHQPRYNVRLKDDKRYPYLKLTVNEPFPGLYMTRNVENDGAKYFGPYTHSQTPRQIIKQISKLFPIRTCNLKLDAQGNSHRVCLSYHIKQCSGPCNDLINPEDYAKIVENARMFLNGKKSILIDKLKRKMDESAANLEFEKAAELRDQIEKSSISQKVDSPNSDDQDAIGIAIQEEKEACVQVLMTRAGKMINREYYFLSVAESASLREIISAFIEQYYAKVSFVPKKILLPIEIEMSEAIEKWLSEKRGSKVALHVPQRGRKLRLVKMATETAKKYLDQRDLFSSLNRYCDENVEQNLVSNVDVNPAQLELKKILNLPSIPERVEGFDISNIGDKFAVASMVVFENGVPAKSEYRRFKIYTVEGQDDFAMMREVITRRFRRRREGEKTGGAKPPKGSFYPVCRQAGLAKRKRENGKTSAKPPKGRFAMEKWKDGRKTISNQLVEERGKLPDLIIIDGGKGQLNAARAVLKELNIALPIVSLAKKKEHLFIPDRKEPIIIDRDNIALRLVQQIRDEAHRFALKYHRTLRRKEIGHSILDEIPQVGPKRKQALLSRFGSLERIREASLDELLAVKGITHQVAGNIQRYFRKLYNNPPTV